MSSQRNQNRSCPGVPNRYSATRSSKVIRPKSIATVVVVFPSTPSARSTPRLASVMYSSVRSGRISLTEPTIVVLPAPNPPAMRIFSASIGGAARSERTESIDHFPQYSLVRQLARRRRVGHPDVAPVDQVGEQDANHTQRH